VAFRRNRFLAVVRSVDMTSINVLDIAILVDAFLLAVNSSTTQAPQAKSKVDNRKGEKMRHRLSALKRSFRLHPDTGTPFAQEGNLDLSKMDANGVLADGTHFVMSTGRFFPITGEAFDIGNETFLKFRHTDGSGRFEGRVTYESGDVIIVSGKLFTPTFKTDDPTVLVQLEEPWVISKP
jgi:hypothetical protein